MKNHAWSDPQIHCGTAGCNWSGKEADLVAGQPTLPGASHKNVCPSCKGDNHHLLTAEHVLADDAKTLRAKVGAVLACDTAPDAASLSKLLHEVSGLLDRVTETPAQPHGSSPVRAINLAGLPFELTKEELDGFYRFCESVSTVHGHGISDALLQRLSLIGLVRHGIGNAFEVTEFGVALNESRLSLPAMDWGVDPANPHRAATESQTVAIMRRGYRVSGFVLRSVDQDDACISEYGAVRWLDGEEMLSLLHCGPETHLTSTQAQLAKVNEAVRDYYADLDDRKHGGIAQHHAFVKIETALGHRWIQGFSKSPTADRKG
jgi:hypothetical protein